MITVRLATTADAPAVVALFRSGFTEETLSYTILACFGVDSYVAALIEQNPEFATSHFVVAEIDGSLVAAVELAVTPGGRHLNYISVAPEARATGIGSEVLLEAMRLAGQMGPGRPPQGFTLDVLAENSGARRWYRRLGFEEVDTHALEAHDLDHTASQSPVGRLTGVPQSEACYQRFGFAEFTVHTDLGRVQVGKLGESWWRLDHTARLEDANLCGILRELDPQRRGLVRVSPGDAARPVNSSVRMKSSWTGVLRALAPT